MYKPVIAISMGDPAGIGAEIIVKALLDHNINSICIPIVVGDKSVISDAIDLLKRDADIHIIHNPEEALGKSGTIDLIDLGLFENNYWEYGKVSKQTGFASYKYVEKIISLAMEGLVHATVTGPITKESLHLAGFKYAGHTEIYADLTNTKNYGMLLTSSSLRVIHVTTHCSLKNACEKIKKDRVLNVIKLANEAMLLLGIAEPKIAVAGLNPHSSENGLFGSEENEEIIPAIKEAQEIGINVEGPIPPDTVFVKAMSKMYDIVVAMYHDQGHIPLKLSGFKIDPTTGAFTSVSGINITVGLPIIRTSVDHGTAFDKAGKGIANEESMVESIELAVTMAKNKFNLPC